MKRIDLTGRKFGRLTVKRLVGYSNHQSRWACICECGKIHEAVSGHLKSGEVLSCGCLQKENRIKHGMCWTAFYRRWQAIKGRCLNPNNSDFKRYGYRGITVCKRWMKFENFLADMGKPPNGLTLDRIDNNKGYSPKNCRWATPLQQANNSRRNRLIKFNCETRSLSHWARHFNLCRTTLRYRINRGWDIDKALKMPIRDCGRF